MKRIFKTVVAVAADLTLASAVFADVSISNPTTVSSIADLFQKLFTFIIAIVGGLAVLFIVIGGIRYIMAQGDPKGTDAAKNQITGAIIGLIIALLAVVIVNVVANFLGAGANVNPTNLPNNAGNTGTK